MQNKQIQATPRAIAIASVLTMTACPLPLPGSDSSDGSSGDSESGATATDTDASTDGGECPAGLEGCPCSVADSCFPGLECFEDVCVPADPCPVGSAGCPCTNGGTCDDGSVCEDGVCQCTPGELGCACDAGACGNALDCIDGECVIPELVSEAANGWGPVLCLAHPLNRQAPECFAARGDVWFPVTSACEMAEELLTNEWLRYDEWLPFGFDECALGVSIPAAQDPWEDAACFLSETERRCVGRIGHLWTHIDPECIVAPLDTFDPWGDNAVEQFGCDVAMPPAPTSLAIDEWRCGALPPPLDGDDRCSARLGSEWVRSPLPPCLIEHIQDPQGAGLLDVGWGPFDCLSAMN